MKLMKILGLLVLLSAAQGNAGANEKLITLKNLAALSFTVALGSGLASFFSNNPVDEQDRHVYINDTEFYYDDRDWDSISTKQLRIISTLSAIATAYFGYRIYKLGALTNK